MGKRMISVLLTILIIVSSMSGLQASASLSSVGSTGVQTYIEARGAYHNWDGVSSVAQFVDNSGHFCFAIDGTNTVTVYKTNNGRVLSGTVALKKQHAIFGTALCDADGNFYLVTGETGSDVNSTPNTVFISKYTKTGVHIKTVGDRGGTYGGSFCTWIPFEAGCCDAAISGELLTVNYARKMYNGHQSNTLFTVNYKTMNKVDSIGWYNSHSFSQRVVPLSDGFSYMSEGDAYDRAFTALSVRMTGETVAERNEENLFDFWVRDGALDDYDMYDVNENFAHMGGITALCDGRIAFAAQSAKSLNAKAAGENEQIFIQIYDPFADLTSADAYTTTGVRSGLAGPNGRTPVANYGVKWLTSYGNDYTVRNVQIASTDKDKIVVLYELWYCDSYKGVQYFILNADGDVLVQSAIADKNARLNPCEMPVFSDGKVYWVGNRYDAYDTVYLYVLDTDNYPDVRKSDWYYNAVWHCVDQGLMRGYQNGRFGAVDGLQRQDFVVILSKIAKADLSKYQNSTGGLKDVKAGSYYAPAVAWAVANGIVSGYQNGKFGVGDPITREQVCTIFWWYEGSPTINNVDVTLKSHKDASRISAFAKTAVAWAKQYGVISGMADGRIAPVENASRAQIAVILTNMDKKGMLCY
ncbi:MAG: S-layer homology domain-containing protein [Clostridia bacterium]|nr:S-layer homology domain-containing protein [Clostridia bacterium]